MAKPVITLLVAISTLTQLPSGNGLKKGYVTGQTENDPTRIAYFNAWFKENYEKDGEKLKLEVRGAQETGGAWGVYATQKIREGELYLKIPKKLLLSVQNMKEMDPGLYKATANVQESTRLIIFLLSEKFVKGKNSFYHPYINTIPTVMDTPHFYSKSEFSELKGTDIEDKTIEDTRQWRNTFRTLKRKDFFLPIDVTWEMFEWAQSIYNTRSIWVGGRPNFVPFLDMVNCKEGPDPNKIHTTKDMSGFANTYAAWSFSSGEQVFENYGQRNYIYFLHHGFALEENSQDCVDVSLSHVSKKLTTAVRKSLRASNHDPSTQYCLTSLKPFPPQFIAALRIASKGDPFSLLIDILHKELEKYHTTPREDHAVLSEPSTSFRMRMIVTFRLSQKKLLMRLVQKADTMARRS
eukprot:TRINITY_DN4771_c1_g1_i1.p1 TRINITY_DN4771_c1_g1~~TRINITY_DN4771_c1_g1_i1.p1  ORF type:complete len:408 (+),score=76.16 TRINITY_DN4771_c1_g1_i1:73-1296(+)